MAASMHITAPRGILLSQLAASVQALRERIAKRQNFQRTVRELSALSPRELADCGLNRSTLRNAAYEAVYLQQR
ncbi:MAG: hypothetical protein ACI8R4_002618 [Paracoccaceae bacterium]|jgi:uncharacterized protein YjiS (DUF1127 family)